ncbi:MAG: FixH family protein [Cruoricaptor ignavus]|nr:FixH family protein [Cruoricaptor ignavus]
MFKKFTWGHGIVIALASFMIFILSMIFFFTKSWQNAELVSNNYYEEELNYQEVIDAKNNADALTAKPTFVQNSAGITITFPEEIVIDKNTVNFHLYRTDDAKLDVDKDLSLSADRSINIPDKVLFPGSYTLKIRWYTNDKPYQIDYDVLWKLH